MTLHYCSARIWEIQTEKGHRGFSSMQNGVNQSRGLVLFGHNARIWDCCIFDSVSLRVYSCDFLYAKVSYLYHDCYEDQIFTMNEKCTRIKYSFNELPQYFVSTFHFLSFLTLCEFNSLSLIFKLFILIALTLVFLFCIKKVSQTSCMCWRVYERT